MGANVIAKRGCSKKIIVRHSELVSESLYNDYEILKQVQDDVQYYVLIFLDLLMPQVCDLWWRGNGYANEKAVYPER
tara:strand:- start:768 stop:998 length:231 start_codon:yes stop_codon:yes gene_type:complete